MYFVVRNASPAIKKKHLNYLKIRPWFGWFFFKISPPPLSSIVLQKANPHWFYQLRRPLRIWVCLVIHTFSNSSLVLRSTFLFQDIPFVILLKTELSALLSHLQSIIWRTFQAQYLYFVSISIARIETDSFVWWLQLPINEIKCR